MTKRPENFRFYETFFILSLAYVAIQFFMHANENLSFRLLCSFYFI
jgi:hypothetical protein